MSPEFITDRLILYNIHTPTNVSRSYDSMCHVLTLRMESRMPSGVALKLSEKSANSWTHHGNLGSLIHPGTVIVSFIATAGIAVSATFQHFLMKNCR